MLDVVSNEADVTDLFVKEYMHGGLLRRLVKPDDVEHYFQATHSSSFVHRRFPPLY